VKLQSYTAFLRVMISSLGALNGWTLLMAQVPMAAAQDHLFPRGFGRLSPRGVPARGIVISAALASALLLIGISGGSRFAVLYDMIVSLSTMAAVFAYVFCAVAPGLLGDPARGIAPRLGVIETVAFVFALFTVYGCGPQAVLWGLLLLLLGIPVYVWQRREPV